MVQASCTNEVLATNARYAVNLPKTTFKVTKELDSLSNKVSPLYHIGLCSSSVSFGKLTEDPKVDGGDIYSAKSFLQKAFEYKWIRIN